VELILVDERFQATSYVDFAAGDLCVEGVKTLYRCLILPLEHSRAHWIL
jgi:hypothetical protein